MSIIEKITEIYGLIKDIDQEDPAVGNILLNGFNLSLRTLEAVAKVGDNKEIDISDQINILNDALGFDMRNIVEQIMQGIAAENMQNGANGEFNVGGMATTDKEADPVTLEFITSNLDDYEKFVAQAKAKDNLDFLSKNI